MKNIWIGISLLMLLLIGGVVGIASNGSSVPDNVIRKVVVQGEGIIEVLPDEARINVKVENKGKDAAMVQEENTKAVEGLLNDLKRAGVDKENIETGRYSVRQWREYERISGRYAEKGFIVEHTMTIKVKDVEQIGKLLEVVVKNGATVNNVAFTLSEKKAAEVQKELIEQASEQAKEKAKWLAESLDASVGEVLTISESSRFSPIWYANDIGVMSEQSKAPELMPRNVDVSFKIAVEFALN